MFCLGDIVTLRDSFWRLLGQTPPRCLVSGLVSDFSIARSRLDSAVKVRMIDIYVPGCNFVNDIVSIEEVMSSQNVFEFPIDPRSMIAHEMLCQQCLRGECPMHPRIECQN